jgi:hypothetical protein
MLWSVHVVLTLPSECEECEALLPAYTLLIATV